MLNSNTKKYFVLIVLFVFPVFIYLFFASGKNNFALLPILSEDINEISSWDSLSGDSIKFEDNISILGFWGSDVINKKTEALNLNQKIYKRFFEFNDFQFVIVLSKGQEIEAESLKKKLKEGVGTNLIKWKFIFGNSEEINNLFNSLNTPFNLSNSDSTPIVFIIDKEKNLRGRDDDDQGILFGFNTQSVAEINNKMVDDVKVILAEFRRALKKYNSLKEDEIPSCECLKDTVLRFLPYWENNISPHVKSGKKIMIVAHGNSLRALVKHLDNISNEDIVRLNIPTGIPLVYELDENLTPIKNYYLGDQERISAKIKLVANQGKSN